MTELGSPHVGKHVAIILEGLLLHDFELRCQHLQTETGILRNAINVCIGNHLEQPINTEPASGSNDAEL